MNNLINIIVQFSKLTIDEQNLFKEVIGINNYSKSSSTSLPDMTDLFEKINKSNLPNPYDKFIKPRNPYDNNITLLSTKDSGISING